MVSSNASISTSNERASPNEISPSELEGKTSVISSSLGLEDEGLVEIINGEDPLNETWSLEGILPFDDGELVGGVEGGCELESKGGLNGFGFIEGPLFEVELDLGGFCDDDGKVFVRRMPRAGGRGGLPELNPWERGRVLGSWRLE